MSNDAHRRLTQILMDKVAAERYPSVPMLDRVEEVIGDRESAEDYAALLFDIVERDTYPSPTMLDRVQRVAEILDASAADS